MRKTTLDKLRAHNPCGEAVKWAKAQTSWQAAWDNCERGDWMLWILGKLSGPPESDKRKKLVLAACDCAALNRKYRRKEDLAVFDTCLKTTREWGRGLATIEQVRDAAADAADAGAVDAAYAAAAAYAAYADAYAAYVTSSTLQQCAVIARKHYPKAPNL